MPDHLKYEIHLTFINLSGSYRSTFIIGRAELIFGKNDAVLIVTMDRFEIFFGKFVNFSVFFIKMSSPAGEDIKQGPAVGQSLSGIIYAVTVKKQAPHFCGALWKLISRSSVSGRCLMQHNHHSREKTIRTRKACS